MKLAFCLFHYFPYGGLQRDFLRIALACLARGHEVHVYTMAWEGEREPRLHLHVIPATSKQNHSRVKAYIAKVQQALQASAFDLVVGFNKMPNLDVYYAADVCYATRLAKKSALICLLPRYRTFAALEKAVFLQGTSTDILLLSAQQQAEFTRHYGTEATRFHLIPPGILPTFIAPADSDVIREKLRSDDGIATDDFLLLMVGSGFKTKGLDRSLRAVANLPRALQQRCHLYVIGDDEAKPFLRLAKKINLHARLVFLGGRSDVARFMLAADVLLHPAYHENTGTVLLEALLSCLPVLTIDCCGYAHYVKEADMGVVLASPFQQAKWNATLHHFLVATQRAAFREKGKAFAKNADIYRLPEHVADKISTFKRAQPLQFANMMALRGECFRQQKGRLTQRVKIEAQHYFIKQHSGVGWREIFKNLLQWRLPVLSAKTESRALQRLSALGIAAPKVVACASRGINPARLQSFILLEELSNMPSLEEVSRPWQDRPPPFSFKQQLIKKIAEIARTLHQNGMNHRDFYLCHFLLDKTVTPLNLYLIDLHRAQVRKQTPTRWIIKDLAGLYFSSKKIGLTTRDFYRFMQIYEEKSLQEILTDKKIFWKKIIKRGEKLYRDHAVL